MKLQKEVALYPGSSESISSQFTIDRTQIDSKVGNGEVISKINQSPEAITIDAERININGVASFGHFTTTETLNSQINSVKAAAEGRQQVIYFAKASGQTATAYKTWVTNTSGDNWVNVRPQYNPSKPVLWTAVQSQTINQKTGNTWSTTCECTTPVIDQTTTVIDGGSIITGSIDANKIQTKSLTIGYFTDSTADSINNTNAVNQAKAYTNTYVTAVGNDGIKVHAANNPNVHYSLINASGLTVYQNSVNVANFGSSARIGPEGQSRAVINSSGITLYSGNVASGFFGSSAVRIGPASGRRITFDLAADNGINLYGGDGSLMSHIDKNIYIMNNMTYRSYKSDGTGVRVVGVSTSNTLEFGASGMTNHFYADVVTSGAMHAEGKLISDYAKTNTESKATNCYLTSIGTIARTSKVSSRRFKHDIKLIENAELNPELLYDIPVVQFKYNKDHLPSSDQRYGIDLPGFIAEDVADIYPVAADLDDDNKNVETWNEQYLIPPMLALIQKQHKEIEELKKEVKKWTKD